MMSKASFLLFAAFLATSNASVLPRQEVGEGVIRPGAHSFIALNGSFADASTPDGKPILCNNITTGASSRCWIVFDLGKNITNFLLNYKEYCAPDQHFDNCILNKVWLAGTTQQQTYSQRQMTDCSYYSYGQIECPKPPIQGKTWDPAYFYIANTIYNVNQYFKDWNNTIHSPASRPALSSIVDLSQTAAENLQTIVTKYGNNTVQAAALNKVLLRPDTGPVSTAVSSTGSTLGTSVNDAVPVLEQRLQNALKRVMYNGTEFLNFVGDDGIFSGNYTTDIQKPPNPLT